MRPTKLIITGFGPYAERTVIEFDKLGTHGLYLICGDTGAGKTTIFDAITFALFGKASGNNRDSAKLFRCANAKPDVPTEVELNFVYDGREYRIVRNPEYERAKSRGEGTTKQASGVTFYYPEANGKVGPGSRHEDKEKDVAEAVKSVMGGLDRDQFSQIAMIAQGDFMSLLLEKTEKRKEIFRKIFKTDNFDKLQRKLFEEASKAGKNCDQLELSARNFFSQVECDETSEFAAALKEKKQIAQNNSIASWNEICELIQKIIEADDVSAKTLKTESDALGQQIAELNAEIGKAELVKKQRNELQQAITRKSDLEKKLAELHAVKESEESKKQDRENLQEQITTIKNSLPQYESLENKQRDLKAKESQLAKDKASLEQQASAIENIKAEIQNLKAELDSLKNSSERINEINSQINDLDSRQKKISEVGNVRKIFTAKQAELEAAQESFRIAADKYAELSRDYENKQRAFMNEQAGILAENLEDGHECPVCGSTHHPHKACKSIQAPTQAEIELLKEAVDKANDKRNSENANAASLKASRDNLKADLEKDLAELFGECTIEEAPERGNSEFMQNKKLLEELKINLAAEQNKTARRETLENKENGIIPAKEEELEKKRSEIETLGKKIAATESEISGIKENIVEAKKSLVFENMSAAESKMKNLQQDLDKSNEALKKAIECYNNCNGDLKNVNGQIDTLSKGLEGADNSELDALLQKKAAATEQLNGKNDSWNKISGRLSQNSRILKMVQSTAAELDSTGKKRQWLKNLSDTANGGLSGRDKVMLETFVQTSYFDRIIRHANVRFSRLSNGQYELVRREDYSNMRSQSGLDLDVLDHTSGKRREVKTLSGGESFLASLSLALGLADEVQSSAGGIQLDTMFVDEGFGSLDYESLKSAIDVLQNLAGNHRLVGIISHVGELEKKLEKKIHVRKNENRISEVFIEA